MAIKGIPTIFNNRRYRSRLEARWAIMFEAMGWEAEYEPFDCNGWIPDFAIKGCGPLPLLVEIKPIFQITSDITSKIDRADNVHEVLLLGAAPCGDQLWSTPQIGWLGEMCGYEDEAGNPLRWWQDAILGRWVNDDNGKMHKGQRARIGFCAAEGSYFDRITGFYDGNQGYGIEQSEVNALWADAGNRVQWRPRADH